VSTREICFEKKLLFCEEINIENHLAYESSSMNIFIFHLFFTGKHFNVSKLKTKPGYVFFECNHTLFNGLLQEMQMQRRGELHCSEKTQQSMEKNINLLSLFLMFPISKFFTLMHKSTTRFHARFATRFHSYI